MRLDVSSFEQAIGQVEEALFFACSDLAREKERIAFQFRASSILTFEYTYELAFKILVRFLEATEPSILRFDEATLQHIIRLGYERGLLNADLREWMRFRKMRGTTSHTYDVKKAAEVFSEIPVFLAEAKFLLAEITRRQADIPGD